MLVAIPRDWPNEGSKGRFGLLALCATKIKTSAVFSPSCFHPVKNSAMVQAPTIDTMPLVNLAEMLSETRRQGQAEDFLDRAIGLIGLIVLAAPGSKPK
jgi:hypothetical protein